MKATSELPDDSALPALAAIRERGLAQSIPALGFDDCPVHFELLRYHSGRRAVIEVRAGQRRFAVKICATDPLHEAAIHEALASAGLANGSGARVPPLFACDQKLRVLVIGWLDGPSAAQLIEHGQGARAGELAASWIQRAAALDVKLGPPLGAPRMLDRARKWAEAVMEADPSSKAAANAVVTTLTRTQPCDGPPRLVNGGLYADHVLDLGDGPGVIDWGRFGQGPLELDAGIFLATISRLRFGDESLAGEVARAERAFSTATANLLGARAVGWHWAAELLRFAKKANPQNGRWPAGARHALLREALRLAETAE